MQNNRLAHPLWELARPQENPGSATARDTLGYVCIPDKRALLTEWELIFKILLHSDLKLQTPFYSTKVT